MKWKRPKVDKPLCESCWQVSTNRHCGRCGARICRACAKDHKKPRYGDPGGLQETCK